MALDKKWISLFFLVLQTSSHSLCIRYSRTRSGTSYDISAVVFISEVIKAIWSLVMVVYSGELFKLLRGMTGDFKDSLKMAIPAILYFVQNNLTFQALSMLDASTYQILYQLKIFTTALFSRFMLKKAISLQQWSALFLLFLGVCVVQLEDTPTKASPNTNSTMGLVCVVACAICSGFSAIYFEKVLKGTPKSIWCRNFELACFSILFGFFNVPSISKGHIFRGFDWLVGLILFLQSGGGLLVGYVVKHADNIMKVFACAIAFLVSTAFGIAFFGLSLTIQFIIGSSMVLTSVMFYSVPITAESKKKSA